MAAVPGHQSNHPIDKRIVNLYDAFSTNIRLANWPADNEVDPIKTIRDFVRYFQKIFVSIITTTNDE